MIDDLDQMLTYVRNTLRAGGQIINAEARDARTPRASVVAHGSEERDEDGHPVGTRVVVQFGSGTNTTSSSSSSSIHTVAFYAAMPATEVGPYIGDQIVDRIKFTSELEQTWVPPSVRHHQR